MNNKNVLLIEDVKDIADIIIQNFKDLDLNVTHEINGRRALNLAISNKYNLIILDLMLPDIDGITICKEIRKKDQLTPIIILTAKKEEIDKIIGLELGADDYITKPFSIREFIARVKALLRRVDAINDSDHNEIINIKNMSITLNKRELSISGKKIELTVKEFELLVLFASNPGRVFSRQELLDDIWGYQFSGYDHTVNTHINRLRNKIEENPSEPQILKTVWGIGYKFSDD